MATAKLLVAVCLIGGLVAAERPIARATTGQAPSSSTRPPADVTSQQDRDQMMAQLGVRFPDDLPLKAADPNRPTVHLNEKYPNEPGRSYLDDAGNTIVRDAFGTWVNYDDAKVGAYTPLQPLRMRDGTAVKTAAEWWSKRRPEIMADVERTIWGRIPDRSLLPKVTWEVTSTTTGGADDVPFVEKRITGHIDSSRYPEVRNVPKMDVALRLPASASGPVPIIIVFSGPNGLATNWNFVKAEGWGLATFDPLTLQPDNGAALTSFVIGLVNQGNWRKPDDWGTLVAYAWGVGRLIDYFETGRDVDATRVGLMGHSRWGKATMVAMAYEPRIAIGYPSAGGTLGAKQFRRHWGQNLESISNPNEYHWMAGNAFTFMGPIKAGSYLPRKVEMLPVDGESLIELAAPRPVFLNGGTTDTWSDAPGTYLAGVAASPVYELLGKKGLVNRDGSVPKPDVAYLEGDLGYRVHTGGHTPAPDWPAFVEFTRKYFRK